MASLDCGAMRIASHRSGSTHRGRADRPRQAAPQARRDRDLRCSTWPFTAPQAIRTALRLLEEGRHVVAAMGSTMATLYAGLNGPRLTAAVPAGPGALSGVLAGGSSRLCTFWYPGTVRGSGARRGHQCV